MKANIKLSMYLPIIVTTLTIIITIFQFEYFSILFIVTSLYIDLYYGLSYVKRKDALIITDNELTVTTAFKNRVYPIRDLSDIQFTKGDNTIRASFDGNNTTLCSDIYSKSIEEIYALLTQKVSNIDINE